MNQSLLMAGAHLVVQIPVLLVCFVGFVLSLVFRRRCGMASVLAMVAMLLMGTETIAQAFVSPFAVHAAGELEWSGDQIARFMAIISVISATVYSIALSFLVGAVFVGRQNVQKAGSQDTTP
jgi:predicted DNA repair protein MutK